MPEDVLRVLGQRLRKARKERSFTQEKLAQQTGVSVRHIAKIEKGTMNPSFEIVVLLCKALNITLDSLTDAKSINGEDLRDIVDLYSACPEQSRPVVKATLQTLVFSLRENEK